VHSLMPANHRRITTRVVGGSKKQQQRHVEKTMDWCLGKVHNVSRHIETYLDVLGILWLYQPILRSILKMIMWNIKIVYWFLDLFTNFEETIPSSILMTFDKWCPTIIGICLLYRIIKYGVNYEIIHWVFWIVWTTGCFLFSFFKMDGEDVVLESWMETLFWAMLPSLILFFSETNLESYTGSKEFEGCDCVDFVIRPFENVNDCTKNVNSCNCSHLHPQSCLFRSQNFCLEQTMTENMLNSQCSSIPVNSSNETVDSFELKDCIMEEKNFVKDTEKEVLKHLEDKESSTEEKHFNVNIELVIEKKPDMNENTGESEDVSLNYGKEQVKDKIDDIELDCTKGEIIVQELFDETNKNGHELKYESVCSENPNDVKNETNITCDNLKRNNEDTNKDNCEEKIKSIKRRCARPGCSEIALKKCSRCLSVWYCTVSCSEQFWPQHRETCTKEKEKRKLRRRQRRREVNMEVD